MCIQKHIYLYLGCEITPLDREGGHGWRGCPLPKEQKMGWGSLIWNRAFPQATSQVWCIPKFRRVTSCSHPDGQETVFHQAGSSAQEQAQQLYMGSGRMSKPGASQGWLGHVWAPNGSSATCSGLWGYTHTLWPCSSLETSFGCYFGTIFWVR